MVLCPPCLGWRAFCNISGFRVHLLPWSNSMLGTTDVTLFNDETWDWEDVIVLFVRILVLWEGFKHQPQVQQTIPISQYNEQSGHWHLEEASQCSKISALFMSSISFFDSSLNLLILPVLFKSCRTDLLFGWLLNFWINFLTVSVRFVSCRWTTERGMPRILQSVFPQRVTPKLSSDSLRWFKDSLASWSCWSCCPPLRIQSQRASRYPWRVIYLVV